jgi:hypothetical protein
VRYYDITISASQGSTSPVTLQTALGTSTAQWTSYPSGVFDPGALDVAFDLYVAPYATPVGGSSIQIWGIDLATLKTAVQFSNPAAPMWVTVKGGMMAGLPLNNPAQAGVLIAGMVWQSFGSWSGTEMKLDLLLNPGGSSFDRPVNIVLNWQKGQALQSALQGCLATAFPGKPVKFAISANLVAMSTQYHISHSLVGLAQFINSITQQMQGAGSLGVHIAARGDVILVFDGTASPNTRQIAFTDLVGQPTWHSTNELWVQTVMRADILVGDTIQLPKELASLGPYVLSPPQSYPAYRDQSVIQGSFLVSQMRHAGRFRAADGTQWTSTYICIPQLMGNQVVSQIT